MKNATIDFHFKSIPLGLVKGKLVEIDDVKYRVMYCIDMSLFYDVVGYKLGVKKVWIAY